MVVDEKMGRFVNGQWREDRDDFVASGNDRFVRSESAFRDWIRADGSSPFKPEAGRYHLYVSHACPWAHRTLIVRKLKRLEDVVSVSVVDPMMGERGWEFSSGPGCTPDPIYQARFLRDIYLAAKPDYSGRVTVPVLWDRRAATIVNNESSEIIRMLNGELDELSDSELDLYPPQARHDIDNINERVYETVNDGVYRCGFAKSQRAYDEAFDALFESLELLEERLASQRYLVGDRLTEADIRLFPTLVRFDPVYVGHFKCNKKRLVDYPNLWSYTRDIFQLPGVAETVDFDHIKRHYYGSHPSINPRGIVPKGPDIDFTLPHDRHKLAAGC